MADVVERLRPRTVPPGNEFKPGSLVCFSDIKASISIR